MIYTAIGFLKTTQQVVVDSTVKDLPVVVLKADATTLKEVVVKSDKPLIEQRADRLVYNAEADKTTMGGTAADVLRNVPMLSVDGNGNVQLRGSSNIRVLINNRPSSIIAASVADALRQLPADMVKTVEVITSPSARYDAEGTAGVINIITKKNTLQGVTGMVNIIPGNVSTIGFGNLSFRRKRFGITTNISTNQFYNTGTTLLERHNYTDNSTLLQEGRTRNRSGFLSPQIGFDVTLNDRNSISGGLNYSPSQDKVRNELEVTRTLAGLPERRNEIAILNHTRQVGYDYNLDYLRTFKDPQKEFSFLMLYSRNHSDNISNQDHYTQTKEVSYLQRNENKSENKEATFQADYTQPLKNKTAFEVGLKAVLREAESNVQYKDIYPLTTQEGTAENIFGYHQNVIAGYLSYSFKALKKVNVKIGSRYENTAIDADFKTNNIAFSSSYDNLIPSINAAYTFKEKHTLRMAYTQRLQRPQLFYLNPYREVIAPQVVRFGNPELDAEVASLYEVGYGTYAPNFSFNASVYGRVTNNAIASSLSLVQDTSYISFLNIARNQTYGTSISGNWKPVKAWSLNGNANVYFAKLQGDATSNKGWMYSLFVGSNLDLGKGWHHGFTGSFNSRRVNLQGRMAAFYYHNTTLRKELFKKRGSLGINLANPLMKGTRVRNNLYTPTFEQREDNINYTRGVRLAFTCRFGKLQQKPPRKPKKTISNDDALRG
jgi:outer membrane receptor protein involved in Fe transport